MAYQCNFNTFLFIERVVFFGRNFEHQKWPGYEIERRGLDLRSNVFSSVLPLAFTAPMSDDVSLAEQTACVDSESEDDWYIIDVFSHVKPELDESNVSHKQLFLYITRAKGNSRTFLQVHNLLREFV